MENLFYNSADDVLRMAINVSVVYLAIVASVRISGKRSTSQMNNFDWIVTVTLGSLAASGILLKNVSLSEAVGAIVLLLALQFVMTKLVFHSEAVARIVKPEPTLVVRDGNFLTEAMRNQRVTRGEILAAVRHSGIPSIDQVDAVVLETDATFSVIEKTSGGAEDLELAR